MTPPPFPSATLPLEGQKVGPQVGAGAAAVLLDLALLLQGLVLVVGIADRGSQMALSRGLVLRHPKRSHLCQQDRLRLAGVGVLCGLSDRPATA
ncbi:MAG: hypothetical protein NTZ40_11950 [Cyanobacteria bacterium]|nr:hypothetical protein [Cyanobacteriota bacterium]